MLQDNKFGSEKGKSLENTLCENTTLPPCIKCRKSISRNRRKNFILTSLILQDNELGSEGGKSLVNALCKNLH